MRRDPAVFLCVLLAAAACGDRPGPERRLEDVTTPTETPSCVVADGEAPGPETWLVREGDTLSGIARRCYGSESLWREIAAANPEAVGARGEVRAGTRLRIPRDTR
jgi:nucleoid-associated protein YgaU